MNPSEATAPVIPNGSGAAAMLAASAGSLVLALLAIAADKSALIKGSLNFYQPTGPLSGVTTLALVVWLLVWGLLELRWGKRTVAIGPLSLVSLTVLALSILLTFPPIADLL